MDDQRPDVTNEDLWDMIEDYVVSEVVRDRLGENAEPWDEMNQDD